MSTLPKVFMVGARARTRESQLEKLSRLFKESGLEEIVDEGNTVAIHVHMGERGNTSYLRPCYVRTVVDLVKQAGGHPYVFDTPVLYGGPPETASTRGFSYRGTAKDYIETAAMNGFTAETMGCPVKIASEYEEGVVVHVNGDEFEVSRLASDADAMIVLSHIHHGLGGAIKNMAMGCATPRGKKLQHKIRKPVINQEECEGCSNCINVCPWDAIKLLDNVAAIDYEICVGCGLCSAKGEVYVCPNEAINIPEESEAAFWSGIAGGGAAVLKTLKKGKVGFLNFLIDITPFCECAHAPDVPYVQDIGILASLDPVAIDSCGIELINSSPGLPNSKAEDDNAIEKGLDKGAIMFGVESHLPTKAMEKLGFGSKKYSLVRL
ncbi:MAG: DUF362 domain-containing protein [Candidatus Ranarchaeia archaeon]